VYTGKAHHFWLPHRVPADLCDLLLEIFARCDPFGVRRAVNRPLLQSISGILAMASPRLGRIPSLGRLTKTSDSSTGLRYSKKTEPRDLPFGSPLQTSSPGQGGGECWFVWWLEFPK